MGIQLRNVGGSAEMSPSSSTPWHRSPLREGDFPIASSFLHLSDKQLLPAVCLRSRAGSLTWHRTVSLRHRSTKRWQPRVCPLRCSAPGSGWAGGERGKRGAREEEGNSALPCCRL